MAAGRAGGRVITPKGVLPFLLALPPALAAVVALVRGQVASFGYAAALTALFFLAAWLIRRGMTSQPDGGGLLWRVLGVLVLTIATAGTAHLLAAHGVLVSLLFGAGAFVGALLAYCGELLPHGRRGRSVQDAQVAAVLAEARTKLQRLAQARYRIQGAPELAQRLDSVRGWIEKILKRIEEDPRDLRRARKFLAVYLDGAGEVAEKYVAYQGKGETLDFEKRFAALLEEMERVSAEQYEKLLHNDSLDLDVQIEVLSERLKKEGVA